MLSPKELYMNQVYNKFLSTCYGTSSKFNDYTILENRFIINDSCISYSGPTSQLPVIITQPISERFAQVGSLLTLVVLATSTVTMTYQWYKNNVLIVGATNPTYTLPQIGSNSAGGYTVVVTNEYGSSTSNTATVTLSTLFACNDCTFSFTQNTPSTIWEIIHNLGYIPNIRTEDMDGYDIDGVINIININHITITFSSPISGKAYLS